MRVTHKGSFKNTERFLNNNKSKDYRPILQQYAEIGLNLLKENTPKDTGRTADSWYYNIEQTNGKIKIVYYNSNLQNGIPIVILLQYGHATKNGGYVEGRDFINPPLKKAFGDLAEQIWREVKYS